MKKNYIIIVLTSALFMSGCTMAPKYKKPVLPVQGDMPSGESYKNLNTKGSDIVSKIKWKDYFTDEKLQKVIKMAIDNNRNLRIAALNVERTMAQYSISRAAILPSGGVSGSMTRTHTPADLSYSGKAATSKQYSANVGITAWELDFFGRIRSLSKQALEQYMATEQAQRGAQITLISSVVQAYLSLAADRGNLQMAQSTLDTYKDTLKLTQKRFSVELATKLDLKQSESQVHSAEANVALYTQLVAQDLNALNLLAGKPVPENLLPENLDSIAAFKKITPNLSSEILLSRPDVMQAEHNLKAAYAYIGAARAACFPSISLTTSVGTASQDLNKLFGSGQNTWTFAPQINIPIFNPSVWINLRVSKVDQKIALAQYEGTVQAAFREVADTLAEYGMVGKRFEAQVSYTDAIEETYRLSNVRYTKGIDSYLVVLDAQRSLFTAKQSLISLRLTRLNNLVKLYAVLGGGGEIEIKKKDKKKTDKKSGLEKNAHDSSGKEKTSDNVSSTKKEEKKNDRQNEAGDIKK